MPARDGPVRETTRMTSTATRPRGARARAAIAAKTLRTDRWWFAPLITVDRAQRLGRVRDGPGLHAQVVLGRGVPLPDPVLLPLRHRAVRRGRLALRPVPARLVDHPGRGADPAVPAAVPADLLLLPQGVLPVVLAVAAGLRGAGRPQEVQRRDPLPAARAEPAPLLLLRRRDHLADQHLGRDPGLPLAARASASGWATSSCWSTW